LPWRLPDGYLFHSGFALAIRLVLRGLRRLSRGVPAMTATDAALLLGQLVAAWSTGFAAGYTLTKFKEAMNQI